MRDWYRCFGRTPFCINTRDTMTRMRQLTSLVWVIVFFSFAALAAGFYAGSEMVKGVQKETEVANAELTERLTLLEETSLLVANDLHALRGDLALESEENEAENSAARALLDEKLSELSGTISTQSSALGTLQNETNLSALIASFSPFVYDITCAFEDSGGDTIESSGSAVLEEVNGGIRFLTNKHVVEEEDADLTHCILRRPNTNISLGIDAEDITKDAEVDVAYGVIEESASGMSTSKRCDEGPAIGDKVIMLGYPQIGGKESITATEGIISGFDGVFYTTSAKIERGNSGGAAIHVKKNCFLGLPTLVFSGRIESLARILPISEIE